MISLSFARPLSLCDQLMAEGMAVDAKVSVHLWEHCSLIVCTSVIDYSS